MKLNAVVSGRFKFVAVKIPDDTSLPARTDRLFPGRASSKNLNMNDVMLLGL